MTGNAEHGNGRFINSCRSFASIFCLNFKMCAEKDRPDVTLFTRKKNHRNLDCSALLCILMDKLSWTIWMVNQGNAHELFSFTFKSKKFCDVTSVDSFQHLGLLEQTRLKLVLQDNQLDVTARPRIMLLYFYDGFSYWDPNVYHCCTCLFMSAACLLDFSCK